MTLSQEQPKEKEIVIKSLEPKLITSRRILSNAQNEIENLNLKIESNEQEYKTLQDKFNKEKSVVDKFTLGNDNFFQMLGMNNFFGEWHRL